MTYKEELALKGCYPQIEKAKAFCIANYENGFDAFVECYSNADWIELATKENGNIMEWAELLLEIKSIQKTKTDYATEAFAESMHP
tara:strand:+ start:162 stop:419 length:258 start_codon:yes stop_codon:yes gene_type:complete